MKKLRFFLVINFFIAFSFAQQAETVMDSDFVVRDFRTVNDSIIFVKKRDLFLTDDTFKMFKKYFIGGYGLKMFIQPDSNAIITVSNELVKNVSSVRFYNKEEEKAQNVYYYTKGKAIDFLFISELNTFVLSLTNNKIIFINYAEKPKFLKTIEINLDSKSRKLIYKNSVLYYITDLGEIYKYNLKDYKSELVHKDDGILTDLYIYDNNNLVYSTIDGEVIKLNTLTNKKTKLKLKNNFILNSLKVNQDKIICGSWNGKIYLIDIVDFSIIKELNFHNRSVIKILNYKDNIFLSSSLDKTIKKWNLN